MKRKYPYMGDYPHQVECNKCGRKFYTGYHSSYGTCRNCDNKWNIEMSEEDAMKIQDTINKDFNEYAKQLAPRTISLNFPLVVDCGRIIYDLETLTIEHYFCNNRWICRNKSDCNNKLVADEL
jgi:hypothetical protein